MNVDKIGYTASKSLQDVIEDAFSEIEDGQGFDYPIGEIAEGTFRIVFEPHGEAFEFIRFEGGLTYDLIFEKES